MITACMTTKYYKPNNESLVYAIGIYKGDFRVLVDPEKDSNPEWVSISDLVSLEGDVPNGWKVEVSQDDDWSFILGYGELINDSKHFNGILERNNHHLNIFREMKNRFVIL